MENLDIIQQLHSTFNCIDNLTRFAETKNAALLAFNGSILVITINQCLNFKRLIFHRWSLLVCVLVGACQLVSLSLALTSMIARTNIPTQSTLTPETANLEFFVDIAQMSPTDYRDAVIKQYGFQSVVPELEKDIAYNTVQVAAITLAKFEKFNSAMIWNLISLCLFCIWIVGIVFLIVYHRSWNHRTTVKQ